MIVHIPRGISESTLDSQTVRSPVGDLSSNRLSVQHWLISSPWYVHCFYHACLTYLVCWYQGDTFELWVTGRLTDCLRPEPVHIGTFAYAKQRHDQWTAKVIIIPSCAVVSRTSFLLCHWSLSILVTNSAILVCSIVSYNSKNVWLCILRCTSYWLKQTTRLFIYEHFGQHLLASCFVTCNQLAKQLCACNHWCCRNRLDKGITDSLTAKSDVQTG